MSTADTKAQIETAIKNFQREVPALERLKHNIGRSYPGVKFKDYYGEFGSQMRHASAPQIEAMARECDAIIGTTAD